MNKFFVSFHFEKFSLFKLSFYSTFKGVKLSLILYFVNPANVPTQWFYAWLSELWNGWIVYAIYMFFFFVWNEKQYWKGFKMHQCQNAIILHNWSSARQSDTQSFCLWLVVHPSISSVKGLNVDPFMKVLSMITKKYLWHCYYHIYWVGSFYKLITLSDRFRRRCGLKWQLFAGSYVDANIVLYL